MRDICAARTLSRTGASQVLYIGSGVKTATNVIPNLANTIDMYEPYCGSNQR